MYIKTRSTEVSRLFHEFLFKFNPVIDFILITTKIFLGKIMLRYLCTEDQLTTDDFKFLAREMSNIISINFIEMLKIIDYMDLIIYEVHIITIFSTRLQFLFDLSIYYKNSINDEVITWTSYIMRPIYYETS